MTTTISSSVLPAVDNMLISLDHILVKAAERCENTKVEESVYLGWRMAPDMHPLATQVRFATEIPARGLSRLAGADIPSFPDDEKTIPELRARIKRAGEIVKKLDKAALDADPKADITVPMGPDRKVTMPREAFAHEWIMPNLYFHVTSTYLILRHLGLDIGKRDFLIGLARYFGEQILRAPKDIVVLTGSGVSAESGVATFRDADGIWAKYDYREMATPEGFAANPELVHEFYNMRRNAIAAVNPNAAHMALAKLEQGVAERGGRLTLVTQNVDNLHERAGSKNILHMHGELNKAECASCAAVIECAEDLSIDIVCASCNRAGGMRPHVVWFGETPRHMDEAADAIMGADLFVSIGTSGSVYPAAGFVAEAHALGVPTMELNLEPSLNAELFTDARYGLATEIVPGWVEEVLAAS